jgi:hypothetical protein
VLSELAETIDPERLHQNARRDWDLPSAQRLGFLLEHVGEGSKVDPLAGCIKNSRARTVTGRPRHHAQKSARWKVIVSQDIEAGSEDKQLLARQRCQIRE